jgi:uncharacterized protein YqhQ
MSKSNIQVGGQAVIEGVMMRSHDTYAVAVRRQDGTIFVRQKPFVSLVKRNRIFALPLLRGAIVLVESLVLGILALSFSGDVVMEDERQRDLQNGKSARAKSDKGIGSKLWFAATVVFSFGIGLFIFFYVPLLLTEWLGAETGFSFNLVDGILRLAIFLLYLVAITMMKDIRRIFEYHGAEHKSIFAFESKKELVPSIAQTFTRFHPRCGTSFLLIVMIVSIFVFMFLGKPMDIGDRLFRLAFIPLIGGISYELIRLSDAGSRINFWRPFIAPGLWLQRLTTKEPDESQLEVAIVALKCALKMDTSAHAAIVFEDEPAMQMQSAS